MKMDKGLAIAGLLSIYADLQSNMPSSNKLDSGEFYVLKLHKWTIFPTEKSNIRENLNIS
jgi:hypothetical protein